MSGLGQPCGSMIRQAHSHEESQRKMLPYKVIGFAVIEPRFIPFLEKERVIRRAQHAVPLQKNRPCKRKQIA